MTDIKIKQLDPLSKRLSDAGFTGGASTRLKNYKIDLVIVVLRLEAMVKK